MNTSLPVLLGGPLYRQFIGRKPQMNVLITGGTGFFGYWLSKTQPAFSGTDNKPLISARYMNRNDYERSHWEWYDWDAVIHCANVSPLRVIHNHKGKLMYISSGAVYKGTSEYADNKRKWEAQCPKDAIIVRPFTFIGEGLRGNYAITNFIEAAKQGKPLEMWSISSVRSYLHGFDLGTWLWKILLEGTGIYDVGSEIPYEIIDVANMVAKAYGIEHVWLIPQDIPTTTYLPDITRVKELGCVETIGLREAIERTKHVSNAESKNL